MHALIFEDNVKLGQVIEGKVSGWRFKNKYKHHNRITLWHKYGTGRKDQEILFAFVGTGDTITKQTGAIVCIKEDAKGKILALAEEDVDALCLYMEIHKTISIIEQHLRYSELNYEDGLKELKAIHEKVSKIDSSMQEWIKPVDVISYLTGIIAKHLSANKLAAGYQVIFSALCESKSIPEASSQLRQLTGSDRYQALLDPSNKEFAYHLSKYDCFMRRTGKCSLELTPQELQEYQLQDNDEDSDSSVHYCRNLLHSFQAKGIQRSVDIQHNTACGHYSFSDGQHRICIAKKANIHVPANIADQQCYCRICSSQRSGDLSFISSDDYIA